MKVQHLVGVALIVAAAFIYSNADKEEVKDKERVVFIVQKTAEPQPKVYQYPDHEVVRVAIDKNALGGSPGMVYQQVGYLTGEGGGMLPLYGKPSYARRGRYYYYTIVNDIKVPVYYENRDCMKEVACDELYDGMEVVVPDYNPSIKWTVKRYENRYNI